MVLQNFQFTLLPFLQKLMAAFVIKADRPLVRLHNRLELPMPFIIPKWQILMISLFYRHRSFLFRIWHSFFTILRLGCWDKTTPWKRTEQQLRSTLDTAGNAFSSSYLAKPSTLKFTEQKQAGEMVPIFRCQDQYFRSVSPVGRKCGSKAAILYPISWE